MNYDTSLPIYLQVMTAIKKEIAAGKIRPGDKLPSGRDLAVQYRINPNTSAKVYQELEMEGISFTKRGLGTFVREEGLVERIRSEMAEELIGYFLQNMEELGYSREEISTLILEEKDNAGM